MSFEEDPTLSAIQRVTATCGVEAGAIESTPGPRQERLLEYEEADRLATFLAVQGCQWWAELPQGVVTDEHEHLEEMRQQVEEYIRGSRDHRAVGMSRDLHRFEVGSAATADEARGLLDRYDHLYPNEDPQERHDRKQQLMDRWADVQVLRQRAQDDREFAPDVAGPRCQLPEGFDVTVIDHSVGGVRYDTTDPDEVLRDLARYRDTVLVDPPANATTDEQGQLRYGDFQAFPNIHGGLSLASDNTDAPFGVGSVERFAHIVGRPPVHSPHFAVSFQAPMPGITGQGDNARSERIPIPVNEVLQVLANVTGLPQIGQAQHIPESSRYNLPGGGYIQITGSVHDYRDHTIAARRDSYAPVFSPPFFMVRMQLGPNTSNEEMDQAAKRLSAWMWLRANRTGEGIRPPVI